MLDFFKIDYRSLSKELVWEENEIFEKFSEFCASREKGAAGEILWKLRNEPKELK